MQRDSQEVEPSRVKRLFDIRQVIRIEDTTRTRYIMPQAKHVLAIQRRPSSRPDSPLIRTEIGREVSSHGQGSATPAIPSNATRWYAALMRTPIPVYPFRNDGVPVAMLA